MAGLVQDLQFALRFLLRNKRTTLLAILCLGLGIALTSGTFSGANPWLFRELPWGDEHQLVGVSEEQRSLGEGFDLASGPAFLDWQRESRAFEAIGAIRRTDVSISTGDEPQRIRGAAVSAGLFPMLRIEPFMGRLFSEQEDVEGRGGVAILSHELWVQHFGSDPDILDKTIRLDGRSHEIVGVLHEGVDYPEWRKVWTPLGLPVDGGARDARDLEIVARLKDGVSIEQAQADLDRVSRRIEAIHPEVAAGWGVRVRPYRERLVPDGIRKGLTILLAGSILVLMISCANAASLLLAQASSREKEIALRAALGATRGRILRQLLTESTLIALVAGAIGLALAPVTVDALMMLAPVEPPSWAHVGTDFDVVVFTTLISVVTGMLFGLVPGLRASRPDLVTALKEGGRSATRDVRSALLSRGLVAGQLAMSIILLVSAILMVRSYLALQNVDRGYDRENLLTWQVTLAGVRYDEPGARETLVREALRRVASLPEVVTLGAVNFLPLSQDGWAARRLEVEGQPFLHADRPAASYFTVSEGYLQSMGVELLEGRTLSRDDVQNQRDVVLVNQSLAERFWPEGAVVGRRIRLDDAGPWLRIAGVTKDVKRPFDLSGSASAPNWQLWAPLPQQPPAKLSFVLRAQSDALAVAPLVRRAFRGIDADLPLYGMMSMYDAEMRVIWVSRQFGALFVTLAVFALIVSSVGLYGLISYSVSQRTQEIGVRMALGGQPHDVLRLVMRQGFQLTLVGVAAGGIAAVFVASAFGSLIYGVDPWDPITFVGTILLLSGVSLVATFLPALRATRVDPVVALRSG